MSGAVCELDGFCEILFSFLHDLLSELSWVVTCICFFCLFSFFNTGVLILLSFLVLFSIVFYSFLVFFFLLLFFYGIFVQ